MTGEQMLDIFSKGASGGSSGAADAAAATLGSGAGFLVGYGAFVYASYTSMDAMASAANKRDGELKSLWTTALDAANAQVRLKQRDVAIAQYESQIAAADLEFANALFRFQQDRFLSADFWNKLTLFANRLMRRYVELGARTAWFAERALAFEQNRSINVDQAQLPAYRAAWRHRRRQPAGGPRGARGQSRAGRAPDDAGQAHGLARPRLPARIRATEEDRTLPLSHPGGGSAQRVSGDVRLSDSRDHGGRARYRRTGPARRACATAAFRPVSADDLSEQVLVRYPDALALSEFRLHDDLFVYGLPGETFLQFEGSGFETDWELELPVAANPKGCAR